MIKSSGSFVIIVAEHELSHRDRIWGTGGWMQPETREALDWLTLLRLLGWNVEIWREASRLPPAVGEEPRGLVAACDPDCLTDDWIAELTGWLEQNPAIVIARAGQRGGALARFAGASRMTGTFQGSSLRWQGPGDHHEWHCRTDLIVNQLDVSTGTDVWATLDNVPVIAARRVGRGILATLGFHPSLVRDTQGAATALLKQLLIWGSLHCRTRWESRCGSVTIATFAWSEYWHRAWSRRVWEEICQPRIMVAMSTSP